MTLFNLNWFDYCLLLIVLLSTIWGIYRGFLREVISVVTWVAAFFLALCFSSHLGAFFHQYIKTEFLSSMIAFILIFILVLLLGCLTNHLLGYLIKGTGLSIPNHLLGGVFGLARGFLIILLLTFLMVNTHLQEQAWFQQSQLTYSLQTITSWMQGKVIMLSHASD